MASKLIGIPPLSGEASNLKVNGLTGFLDLSRKLMKTLTQKFGASKSMMNLTTFYRSAGAWLATTFLSNPLLITKVQS